MSSDHSKKKESIHLPVLETASSLRTDGSRNHVHPADVRGRFARFRYLGFALLIGVWAILPWIEISGRPAVFLDVAARQFFLFGLTFNAQDFWLMFFVLTGIGLTLIYVTALLGRVWCGWACPQTVFLEGVFRRIERLVEGPRNMRLRLHAGPWNFNRLWRTALKHTLFILSSLAVSHIFLSFFVSMPSLLEMIQSSPLENPTAFTWMAIVSGIFYGNFAWFREQTCMIICPYGRLQSVLTDSNSLVVGYDKERGEPRGKAKDPNAGSCVDCNRCVAVCPTGIDIRNGLQLDCVGCTSCIDACDEVMDKLKRPRGLIRYDSLNSLEGKPSRIWRPRIAAYTGILVTFAVISVILMSRYTPYEANLLRIRGAPYITHEESIRNLFQLHVINKEPEPATFEITGVEAEGQHFTISVPELELEPLAGRTLPIFVDVPTAGFESGQTTWIRVHRQGDDADDDLQVDARVLGPQ